MKRLIFIVMVIALLPVLVGAQANFSVEFDPSSIKVNNFSTASFDPFMPELQPVLTTLTISNTGTALVKIDLKLVLEWNNILLVETIFSSKDSLKFWTLTNRDLITNEASTFFDFKYPNTNITVKDAIEKSPTLKSAVLAGYFPDGELKFKVWVREYSDTPWTNNIDLPDNEFTIKIRNAGNITLLSPGVPIGKTPALVSGFPLSFLWNSQLTDFNKYKLIIKEFPPGNPPSLNTVDRTGAVFYETPDGENENIGFAEFLPFTGGNYYTWKVTTALATEYNLIKQKTGNDNLSSNWYVFQFVDEESASTSISEFQTHLNMLQNNTLLNLYTEGYVPTGIVIIEDTAYSGQDAIELIDALQGQEISVELKD